MANEEMTKSVRLDEVKQFMTNCLTAAKVPLDHAVLMADMLATADYRGHFSHGMNRLEWYVTDLLRDELNGAATPTILKQTPATAWVDCNNGLGAVGGRFCMDLAIEKAKTVGVGWVSAKGCTHYGIAGWYAIHAQEQGLIGISMTNTSPAMCPTRSVRPALGTNPICVAAPANDGDSFVLDMATTAVALGKIEVLRRKGQPIPSGWALGPDGKSTTDANLAIKTGCVTPLGGDEITSGYKGYGLGAMVEVLSGISAGANYATTVPKWSVEGPGRGIANLAQVFIAVDPGCFAPGFTDRMSNMNDILRNLQSVDPSKPVLVSGDPERAHMQAVDEEGGIRYHISQLENCDVLADRLGVPRIASS